MAAEVIEIVANGERRQVAALCTVAELVAGFGLKPTQVVVELNGEVVVRDRCRDIRLNEGDRVEIVVPVAGG
jgi:thiamine biosynthesis protein ThiS